MHSSMEKCVGKACRGGCPGLDSHGVADTVGDAKEFYLYMLRQCGGLDWMGLSQKEFQRVGRPETAGIEAAVEPALRSAPDLGSPKNRPQPTEVATASSRNLARAVQT